MDIQLLPIDQFQTFLICFGRVAGFVGAIPVIMSNQTPARIKAGLAFMLSLVLYPIMSPSVVSLTMPPLGFLLLMFNEVLLGSMIGLIARMVFTAVEYGGTIIGYQMGFAAANVFDPSSERQIELISQFQ
ncbi:MAG: flagellar biosynthetic protein FliR, partial [Proteobacteria bacterium]|nr:flagellar biosynthetic protein FliR [Pseudomonadota bacterium]